MPQLQHHVRPLIFAILIYSYLTSSLPSPDVPQDIARAGSTDISDTIDSFCIVQDPRHAKWYSPHETTINTTDCWTAYLRFQDDAQTQAYPDRNVDFSDTHRNLGTSEKLPKRFEGDVKQCVLAIMMRESLRHIPGLEEVLEAAPKAGELQDVEMYSVLVKEARTLWNNCPLGPFDKHDRPGYRVAGTKNSIAMMFWGWDSEWDRWEGFDERARLVMNPDPLAVS